MNDLQTFDFSSALEIIREGGRVARDTWAESTFLFLVKGDTVTDAIENCYGDPEHKGVHQVDDAIYLHTKNGTLQPWFASSNDMLSSNWIKL